MNDNLDDFLNSLGITDATQSDDRAVEIVSSEEPSVAQEEESPAQSLSDQDFADILQDFGFNASQEAEAEELDEEESEEEEEEGSTNEWQQTETSPNLRNAFDRVRDAVLEHLDSAEEMRDLDAEEEADWQEAIDSEVIVPVEAIMQDGTVHFHMPNGEVIDAPIVQENTSAEVSPGAIFPQAIEDLARLEAEAIRLSIAAVNARSVSPEDYPVTPDETTSEPPAQIEEPLIPLNSPTLLLDESTTRFSGAEWYNEIQKKSIIFGGIGGIGSNATFQLSRMHPASLVMYDDDTVETVNMAGQLYSRNDVGKAKVAAIYDMISAYTNMQNIYAIRGRFTERDEAGDIMMCGFDNMEARKTFFEKWLEHVEAKPTEEQKNCLYLDGRLSIDCLQVLCITGDDRFNINRYRSEFLFSDEEAEHTACSMKQTTYLACMIGSIMVNLFTNWVANSLDPIIPYDLPFFTEYDAQNMIFKTEK